jgi:hypothetical protein
LFAVAGDDEGLALLKTSHNVCIVIAKVALGDYGLHMPNRTIMRFAWFP